MSKSKFHTANLRLKNAAVHIEKVNALLKEKRPFTYFLETDTRSGERFTFAKKDDAAVDAIGVASYDAFHNMRTALDNAYWQVVSPFATTEGERKAIQFPFCVDPTRLNATVQNRLAHKVSGAFVNHLIALKPHGEPGGNKLLYLLDKAAAGERHRDSTPTADYTAISGEMIRKQVPDFPSGIGNISISEGLKHVAWQTSVIPPGTLGEIAPPYTCVFRKELAVPIEIIFVVAEAGFRGPVVPTLYKVLDIAKTVIAGFEAFVP